MHGSVFALLCRHLIGLSIALCLASPDGLRGQDYVQQYVQQKWHTDRGLPHGIVNQVCQDREGFLWLATAAGLSRFDGYEFKAFIPPLSFQRGGLNIRDVAVEDDNTLVMLVAGGQALRLRAGHFSVHPVSDSLARDDTTMDLFTEPDGTVWVGVGDGKLLRWRENQVTVFGAADGIDRRAPRFSFARDTAGRTWIGTGKFLGYYENGRLTRSQAVQGDFITVAGSRVDGPWVIADGRLYKLSGTGAAASILAAETPWTKEDAAVRAVLEDSRGGLWVSTIHRGITRWAAGEMTPLPHPYDTVHAIFEDDEGNIWTGTDGDGVAVLKPKLFTLYNREAGLPEIITRVLCSDRAGNIWFANGKGGLVQKRGSDLILPSGAWAGTEAYAVYPDLKENLWVGTNHGVYLKSADSPGNPVKPDVPIKSVRFIYCTRAGDIWIASTRSEIGIVRNGKFHLVSSGDRFHRETFNAITEDHAGNVWVGAASGRLYGYADGEFSPLPRQEGLPRVPIHALCVDRSGGLWIGTANGLLMRQGDSFARLTEEDGLPDSMILQLIEDDQGRLWFGSRRGFFNVSIDQLRRRVAGRAGGGERIKASSLGKDEGLAGVLPIATGQPSAWKDQRGSLWFTTHQGVVSIDPAALPTTAPAPRVVIDDVLIDDIRMPPRAALEIPPGHHRVEFRFSAITFSAPGKVRLRHRLVGVDPAWIDTNSARSASYSGLSPGRYTMEVTASNEAATWREPPAAQVVVAIPHWWQTTWSHLFGLGAAASMATWAVRHLSQLKLRRRLQRLEHEHALEKERARISRDVHDELGSSVTGVRFLVSRLKEKSSEPVRQTLIEQLSRQTQRLAFDLERVVWAVSPKSDSLDRLVAFAGKFVQNFLRGSGIDCRLELVTEIPPWTIQPDVQHHLLSIMKEATNNVLKHSGARHVVVTTGFAESRLTITIADDGSGFVPDAPENSERNGLDSMRSRASEIGGTLTIRSTPGAGTEIRLSVPLAQRGVATR